MRMTNASLRIGVATLVAALTLGGRPLPSTAAASCTTSFSVVPSPKPNVLVDNRFTAVDPRTSTDVWAVGSDRHSRPLVERFDGATWTIVDTPQVEDAETTLYGVAALSSSDVWVVGQAGFGSAVIMHWDGTGWTFSPTSKHGGALAIDARSPSDIWAVGDAFSNALPLTSLRSGITTGRPGRRATACLPSPRER